MSGAYGRPLAQAVRLAAAPGRALEVRLQARQVDPQRITFTEQQPVSFWEEIPNGEYGFWANVNPEVPHPRWSQATEERIGPGERIPTQLFNGYHEFVADLYPDLENKALFI